MTSAIFSLSFFLCVLNIRTVVAWSYHNGGADWEGTCSEGTNQSPILIPFAEKEYMTTIDDAHLQTLFEFGSTSDFTVSNNGHSITLSFDQDDFFSDIRIPIVDGMLHGVVGEGALHPHTTINIPAFLYNFHLHEPSEHSFDGQFPPLEAHMVHVVLKDFVPSCPYDTCLSVVAIRFQYTSDDEENPFIASILEAIGGEWPEEVGDLKVGKSTIDFNQLLPSQEPSYAVYNGSLTTPPCTEYVLWHVIEEPLPVSVGQVAALERVISFAAEGVSRNSRTIQPLNGRTIGYVGAV